MICRTISRRIQKLDLSESYKNQFQSSLESVQRKYRFDALNKAFLIKKICTKYLKICNSLLPSQQIQSSLSALQFIKSLELDIYEGKSYQLYVIKITLHILYVRCYDIKIQQLKDKSPTTTIKRRNLQQEQKDWRTRRHRYIERLKMFCAEIQQCYFSTLLIKDYYSNLEQLYFLCLKQQMERVIDEFCCLGNVYQFEESLELNEVQKYIDKLYQLLKAHILELNQMLTYQQKKIYQIITVKVNFMVDAFIVEAVVKFVQYVEQERMSKSQVQQRSEILGAIQKFFDQEIDTLWKKYDNVFCKVPNNVDKQQAYRKVQRIVKSFTEYPKSQDNLNQKIDTNKFQSRDYRSESFHKDNKISSKYRMKKDAELKDLMSFVQQTKNINQKSQQSQTLKNQKIELVPKVQAKKQLQSIVNHIKHKQILSSASEQMERIQKLSFSSDGFRRLNSLKSPSMSMLQKMKSAENQRLRRINSTDLIKSLKTPLLQPLNKSIQKKKDRRSKTQYLPFIGFTKESSNKNTFSQFNNLQRRNSSNKVVCPLKYYEHEPVIKPQTNNLNENSLKPKQLLRLNTRSRHKKTTLDMMSLQQYRNSYEKRETKDCNSELQNKLSLAEQVSQESSKSLYSSKI